MHFSQKKLTPEQIVQLKKVAINTIEPYAFMLAPAYVFLKANKKFVAVKGPLDFFLPKDLKRLASYKYFYFPEFVMKVLPFREAAQQVKVILSKREVIPIRKIKKLYPDVYLVPPPFELSDEVLQIIGPMWWFYSDYGPAVEPYFLTVFVNELCDLLPPKLIVDARDKHPEILERAIFRSSWTVFIALHVGYTNLKFLNELRLRSFNENVSGMFSSNKQDDIEELIMFANSTMRSDYLALLRANMFLRRSDKISQKVGARMERIREKLISQGSPPTIFGEQGILDG